MMTSSDEPRNVHPGDRGGVAPVQIPGQKKSGPILIVVCCIAMGVLPTTGEALFFGIAPDKQPTGHPLPARERDGA